MKRFFAIMTALALLLSSAAAEAIQEDALLILAQLLAKEVDLAASSSAYLDMYSPSDEIIVQLDDWREGEHSAPTAVYRITPDEDYFADKIDADMLSPLLVANALNRHMVGLITELNARHGVIPLVASTSVQISTALLGTVDSCIYVLCFEDGADVAVCFSPVDGGLSNATALFLADKYTQESLEEQLDAQLTVETIR